MHTTTIVVEYKMKKLEFCLDVLEKYNNMHYSNFSVATWLVRVQ